ncbi:MAG: hypothetical protein SFT81_07695 [Candidatus Caenarcaniphilales bacterium]|nr:hypothetical protein [Candidatus Caenarcaniphilales bacterium]
MSFLASDTQPESPIQSSISRVIQSIQSNEKSSPPASKPLVNLNADPQTIFWTIIGAAASIFTTLSIMGRRILGVAYRNVFRELQGKKDMEQGVISRAIENNFPKSPDGKMYITTVRFELDGKQYVCALPFNPDSNAVIRDGNAENPNEEDKRTIFIFKEGKISRFKMSETEIQSFFNSVQISHPALLNEKGNLSMPGIWSWEYFSLGLRSTASLFTGGYQNLRSRLELMLKFDSSTDNHRLRTLIIHPSHTSANYQNDATNASGNSSASAKQAQLAA